MKKPKSKPMFDNSDFPVSVVRKQLFSGTGVDIEEADQKPIIGIVNSYTEINAGHAHLNIIAQRVKEGVHAAGGLPYEFNVPAPCDGMTEGHEGMRFVLAQRDLIADITETHARSMLYDGLVFIASCDKIIPGMLMAAARLDLPSIFITGGPNAMNIRFNANMKDSIDHKDYNTIPERLGCATCGTFGSCEVMGTANTFQCLTEAMGISLPGSATVPAFHADKLRFARKAGKRIVAMVEEGLTARKILNRKSIENAIIVDLAIGGSTNSTLHLPAIAHELGVDLPLDIFNEFNVKIPTLCGIAPSGPSGVIDLHIAGGVPAVMKVLADDIHKDAMVVTGNTLGEVLDFVNVKDPKVIPPRDKPFHLQGGTVVLKGNLAPDGSVVKQSAVKDDMKQFRGPARVFDSEAACLKALREKTLKEGEVVVIRYEGPKGGPGMPETLAVTMGLEQAGLHKIALITDGRFSGASAGPCIGHVSPEAAAGGPIAAVRDGDEITIDIPGRKLEVALSDEEIKKRLSQAKAPVREIPAGFMRRYVKLVGSAARGAILES